MLQSASAPTLPNAGAAVAEPPTRFEQAARVTKYIAEAKAKAKRLQEARELALNERWRTKYAPHLKAKIDWYVRRSADLRGTPLPALDHLELPSALLEHPSLHARVVNSVPGHSTMQIEPRKGVGGYAERFIETHSMQMQPRRSNFSMNRSFGNLSLPNLRNSPTAAHELSIIDNVVRMRGNPSPMSTKRRDPHQARRPITAPH